MASDTVTAVILPYATSIPDRKPRFKGHRTLGQVKAAVGMRMIVDRPVTRYARPVNGTFNEHMTVYKLDQDGNYVPWIEIRKGSRRSDHPELMPDRPAEPLPIPDNPPGHSTKNLYGHLLKCGHEECEAIQRWTDTSYYINTDAMADLRNSGWTPRALDWVCVAHKEENND